MSIPDLKINVLTSFFTNVNEVTVIEHTENGNKKFTIKNVFPFTSLWDFKRMIWVAKDGDHKYAPKFQWIATPSEEQGRWIPLEFHYGEHPNMESDAPDPLNPDQRMQPIAGLIESNERLAIFPIITCNILLETAFQGNMPSEIHIWTLAGILENQQPVNLIQFSGFVQYYFPWLLDILDIRDGIAADSKEEIKNSYEVSQKYITIRQNQLITVENALERINESKIMLSLVQLHNLRFTLPALGEEISLAILFYQIKPTVALPFIRLFTTSRLAYPLISVHHSLDHRQVEIYTRDMHSVKEGDILMAKIPFKGADGSILFVTLLIYSDMTARIEYKIPRADMYLPGQNLPIIMQQVRQVLSTLPFDQPLEPNLAFLNAQFEWTHPDGATTAKPEKEEIQQRLSCFQPLFISEKPLEKNTYSLRYRAVDNYDDQNEMWRFITRFWNQMGFENLSNATTLKTMTDGLGDYFGLSYQEAQQEINDWWQNRQEMVAPGTGLGDHAVPQSNDGVTVIIKNQHPTYIFIIQDGDNEWNISRIFTALIVMLQSPLDKIQCAIVPKEVVEAIQEGYRVDLGSVNSALSRTGEDENVVSNSISEAIQGDKSFLDGFPDNEEELNRAVDEEMSLGNDKSERAQAAQGLKQQNKPGQNVAVRQTISGEPIPFKITNSLEPISQFYLTALKDADRDLFNYKAPKGSSILYSRKCQSAQGKQPNVLSEGAFNRVKRLYEGRVTFIVAPFNAQVQIDLSANKKTYSYDYVNKRPVWLVLEYASPNNRKNYYLCPEYWCVRDDLPLLKEEFIGEMNHHGISKMANTCTYCTGGLITNMSSPAGGETVIQRNTKTGLHQFISFMKDSEKSHPSGLMLPCCGIKAEAELLYIRGKIPSQPKAVRRSDGEDIDEELLADLELELIDEQAPDVQTKIDYKLFLAEKMTTTYVKKASVNRLTAGTIALVPPGIDKLFGQNSGEAIKKAMAATMRTVLNPTAVLFVRIGIQNNSKRPGDNFLNLLAYLLDLNSPEEVINYIVDRKNIARAFESANYGTLVHEFSRPERKIHDNRIQAFASKYGYSLPSQRAYVIRLMGAFDSFIDYLRNPLVPKDPRYLEHLLMNANTLERNGVILFRIEKTTAEEKAISDQEYKVVCPAFGIPSGISKNISAAFVIHDPEYHFWQPLVLFCGNGKGAKLVNMNTTLLRSLPATVQKNISQWLDLLQAPKIGCGRLSPPPHVWIPGRSSSRFPRISELNLKLYNKTPSAMLRDRSNRFVGLIFKVGTEAQSGFYVPALDDGNLMDVLPREYESSSIPRQTLDALLNFYVYNAQTNEQGISSMFSSLKPVAVLIRLNPETDETQRVGLRLACNAFIPCIPASLDSTVIHTEWNKLKNKQEDIKTMPWERDEAILIQQSELGLSEIELTSEELLEETYQSLRISFSQFLQADAFGVQIRENLSELIAARHIPLYERRRRADMMIEPLVKQWIEQAKADTEKPKQLPLLRKDCIAMSGSKSCDGLCSWSQGRCRIHVYPIPHVVDPIRVLSARLVDELLRFHSKASEILDNYINPIRPFKGRYEGSDYIILAQDPTVYMEEMRERSDRGLQKTEYTQADVYPEDAGPDKTVEQQQPVRVNYYALPKEYEEMGFVIQEYSAEINHPELLQIARVFKKSIPTLVKIIQTQKEKLGLGINNEVTWSVEDWYALLTSPSYSLFSVVILGYDSNGSVVIEDHIKPKRSGPKSNYLLIWGPKQMPISKGEINIVSLKDLPPDLILKLQAHKPIVAIEDLPD